MHIKPKSVIGPYADFVLLSSSLISGFVENVAGYIDKTHYHQTNLVGRSNDSFGLQTHTTDSTMKN